KLLIEYGAKVNTRLRDGTTPLMIAANMGDFELVKFLLENGAKINKKAQNGTTALWIAVTRRHSPIAMLLIENGAHVDIINKDIDVSILMIASQNGHTEIVRLFCEWGSDINLMVAIGGKEYSALMLAERNRWKEASGVLESVGAKE
ncbi:MAG: ankyrin repeat domain-containing protein, partial [Deltaproteobacteria bacterium]|nr:ankyrin repeat domain-containing protein [Deltaproteobacteria bacterium]